MKNYNIKIISLFFVILMFLMAIHVYPVPVSAEEKPLLFSTWEGFEVDKCAAIWLIKRFIDQNATIRFYSKGDEIKEGILFDTPDAKFRRYYNMSTYESLLKHYKINDSRLIYIGKIIHDIEVNTWEKKKLEETRTVQDTVNKLIWESNEKDSLIEKTNKYFDSLYSSMESGNY